MRKPYRVLKSNPSACGIFFKYPTCLQFDQPFRLMEVDWGTIGGQYSPLVDKFCEITKSYWGTRIYLGYPIMGKWWIYAGGLLGDDVGTYKSKM